VAEHTIARSESIGINTGASSLGVSRAILTWLRSWCDPVGRLIGRATAAVRMHPTRKTQRRAGKDSIAAPQGQDNVVNAVAGCAAALHNKFYDPFMGCGDDDDPDGRRAWQAFRLWQHIARYG